MAIVRQMINQLVRGPREHRISAAVTLVTWFALGAFITSTLTDFVLPAATGNKVGFVGGILAALCSLKFTA